MKRKVLLETIFDDLSGELLSVDPLASEGSDVHTVLFRDAGNNEAWMEGEDVNRFDLDEMMAGSNGKPVGLYLFGGTI